MAYEIVLYSVIGAEGLSMDQEELRTVFVPEGMDPTDEIERGARELRILERLPAPPATVEDGFWYVRSKRREGEEVCEVLSKKQILGVLSQDRCVEVISGPFATFDEASEDMEARE